MTATRKDESSKAMRDAKNAANVAGLLKMYPPKKQNAPKKGSSKKK